MIVRRLVLLLVALAAVSCSGPGGDEAAPTTVAETTTTVATATTTSRTVPATTTSTVPRTTTTTVVTIGPGDAFIGGTVTGPAGPIDGATVRVERLVGRATATAEVTTSGGGAWQLASVLGGAYRVRAFKPPEFAQSPVEAFFLAANDRKIIDFQLMPVGGDRITAAVNPNPPRVAQPAVVTITIGIGRVDDQGRPVMTPRPGVPLTLSAGAGIVLESAPQVVTDANGSASWQIRCTVEGANTLVLGVGTGTTQVTIPACSGRPG
ncbi:MAG: carboxypeptidase-like regulatory domain-containing protein [Actinomycetota bacterium]|nr:carboxypeptidase-like regulatory domain-containing protein [Actinomycetota bacterium]